ncbi:hypothetical protein OOZ51_20350 [Arthrobacter sp. MI7-26]|uniref:hypothetical protein n=1 Tax=Arthrobacter sp. MI7-26 TaxID=2993653 RepID=UPI002248C5F8|nr:hypothetical protein [Arthrobacter sp. MI7-26]MCX2750137.1 hypothetical protein [Arthrobacter sp. MI7-26]
MNSSSSSVNPSFAATRGQPYQYGGGDPLDQANRTAVVLRIAGAVFASRAILALRPRGQ